MTLFLDENFPASVGQAIEESGHRAIAFSSVCEFGSDDETVFQTAQRLNAVILTSDRDFYHTIPLLHPEHNGIVVVALRQPNRTAIEGRVRWFLANVSEPLANKTFILRDFSMRIKL